MALNTQCCVSLNLFVFISTCEIFAKEASSAQYRAVHSLVFRASVASKNRPMWRKSMWVLNSDDFFSGKCTDHCVGQYKFLSFMMETRSLQLMET